MMIQVAEWVSPQSHQVEVTPKSTDNSTLNYSHNYYLHHDDDDVIRGGSINYSHDFYHHPNAPRPRATILTPKTPVCGLLHGD